jgi:hypothetical protein
MKLALWHEGFKDEGSHCSRVRKSQLRPVVSHTEAGFLVRVHPEPCLILTRAQIRALFCSSKSKLIPA